MKTKTLTIRPSQKGLWVSNETQRPETNLEHVVDFHHRLVVVRQYLGKKGEFARAHGMGNGGTISSIEKQRLRTLKHLAAYADKLGVRLELNIRLPEDD
ncbi:hypothetical protein SEA_THUNDERCLAP_68 [Arthrobacter phage Thunderclap]|uniref:Helix-turn-helix DNA-binding domain protein n=10 Tax=Amigovirus amigo TaxID=1982100 RepID=A0A0U4B615_9CAUD|nr:DNA binding protein [Arthrobacter phage Amigo]ALY08511.1 hypothetical protein ANANSI_68 [Arthrobacter phage Anansi]ALY09125.1 hypothetical protein GORGEOUS_68 [Arthrobacter phage Gorgeous]ALY10144.1 hypothetical protein RINGS_69 [Arthrobacter phage Rings]ALY10406.1 hypothetical protein SORJUANA_68 [Arthrobacter phage SorJuana]QFG08360.1 hypothetical protein SEA_YEEZUS_68 [Arthrobacter phage Yeezus]QFG13409.1 hypothetical protein SEA_ICHOR_68 [Arthrobacter phage Ichor]QFG13927.1 hypothetic